ncbi:MAG: membrane protein insertase YidC [Chitinophagaceae bacterium]|nr:membrane protein insertase YidC [Oligoflexus sp.]
MNWDKKSITATMICFLFVMGYMYHLQNKYPDYYQNGKQASDVPGTQPGEKNDKTIPASSDPAMTTPPVPGQPATIAAPTPTTPPLTEGELTFDTKQTIIKFDQTKGGITDIRLKDYAAHKGESEPINLLDSEMFVQGTVSTADKTIKSGFAGKRDANRIAFTRTEGSWEITQTYTIPTTGYGFDVDVAYKNLSDKPQDLNATALVKQALTMPTTSGGMFSPSSPADVGVVYGLDGKRNDVTLKKACASDAEAAANLHKQLVDYVGFDKHYFLGLLWARAQTADYLVERGSASNDTSCEITTQIGQQLGLVSPGQSATLKLSGYFGPKEVAALEAYDPNLKSSIKLGWFSFVARPLLSALKGVHDIVQNWGLAIIIVTFILKLAFFPLTRAAAISTKRMQKLQPEMNALKERLKDDPARQQRELMAFMSKNKVNPFKGCLPILPQVPVFIAFYTSLSQAIELRHAPFYGWLVDLSSKDPYYITPIILGLCMFAQQKLTPNPGMDKNQEKIMLLMPVIFSFMMLSLPAGMVLYMLTNTIVSIAQQRWLNHRMALKDL